MKDNRKYFGYKMFVTIGAEQGYVAKISVTPANVSEFKHFENVIEGVEISRYYADKGGSSVENREILKKISKIPIYTAASEISKTPFKNY